MIESLEIENFKSIKKANIKIKPVTILIGPNGSGKSNIIQFLMLLKQSKAESELIIDGKYRNFVSIEDICYFKNLENKIKYKIHGKKEFPSIDEKLAPKFDILNYSISNSFNREQLADQNIIINLNLASNQSFKCSLRLYEKGTSSFNGNTNILMTSVGDIRGGISIRIKEKPQSEEQRNYNNGLISRLKTIWVDLNEVFFIPASRGIIFPQSPLTEYPSEEFYSSKPNHEQAEILMGTLGYKPEITEKISNWTEKITGLSVKSKIVPSRSVTVHSEGKIQINITNEGFGLNQLIFLLAQLYLVPAESTITIEEPESHLHPRAQAELINVILEIAKEKKLKLILTTHSEHILFAFLTHVAKKTIDNDDVSLNYFEKSDEGSKVTEIAIEKDGTIMGGLPGFFEANLSAYKSYIDALTQNLDLESK